MIGVGVIISKISQLPYNNLSTSYMRHAIYNKSDYLVLCCLGL